ncbi:MAG TPA: hypothetical protein VES01_10755 [Dermatophilaceae bacterium]|nr:hypothetical protein [Dermatophilaceae bacterium]
MLHAVAVCPPAPVMLEGLGGAGDPAAWLRRRSAETVAWLVSTGARRIVVVGEGPATRCWPVDAPFSTGIFTGRGGPGVILALPVALALGRQLLLSNAADPARLGCLAVAPDESPASCLARGAELADGADSLGLLVMADGARDHDVTDRPADQARAAGELDRALLRAFTVADPGALAALDPAVAATVGCSPRAVWQVLAGAGGSAFPSRQPVARVDYHGAPFGVTYLIGTWDLTDASQQDSDAQTAPEGATG